MRVDYLSRWEGNVSYTQYTGGKSELATGTSSAPPSVLLLKAMDMKAPALRFAAGAALALLPRRPGCCRDFFRRDRPPSAKDLTPLGAEKAGNADGTIPEDRRHHQAAAGLKLGEHHRDPYADDKPLFRNDKSKLDKYRDKLSPGHQRMLAITPRSS